MAGTEFTPIDLGGLPPLLNHIQVIFVSKAGNDSNSGLNMNNPVLTIGQAITLANAIITGPITDCKIMVVDGGTYTENLTIPEGVHIEGIGATLVGNHTMDNNCSLVASRLFKNAGSSELIDKTNSSDGHAHVHCHIADGRGIDGTVTGGAIFRNSSNGSVLHVHCDVLFVGESQIGLTDGSGGGDFGHLHFRGSDIYLAGTGAMGCRTSSAGSKMLITVDHILELGSFNNTTAFDLNQSASEVWCNTNQVIADTAWDVNSGTLRVQCLDVRGDRQGEAIYNGVSPTLENLTATGTVTLEGSTYFDAYYNLTGPVTFDIDTQVKDSTAKVYNLTVIPNGNSFSIPAGWEVYGSAFDTAATNNLTIHVSELPTTGQVVKVFIDQPL